MHWKHNSPYKIERTNDSYGLYRLNCTVYMYTDTHMSQMPWAMQKHAYCAASLLALRHHFCDFFVVFIGIWFGLSISLPLWMCVVVSFHTKNLTFKFFRTRVSKSGQIYGPTASRGRSQISPVPDISRWIKSRTVGPAQKLPITQKCPRTWEISRKNLKVDCEYVWNENLSIFKGKFPVCTFYVCTVQMHPCAIYTFKCLCITVF